MKSTHLFWNNSTKRIVSARNKEQIQSESFMGSWPKRITHEQHIIITHRIYSDKYGMDNEDRPN